MHKHSALHFCYFCTGTVSFKYYKTACKFVFAFSLSFIVSNMNNKNLYQAARMCMLTGPFNIHSNEKLILLNCHINILQQPWGQKLLRCQLSDYLFTSPNWYWRQWYQDQFHKWKRNAAKTSILMPLVTETSWNYKTSFKKEETKLQRCSSSVNKNYQCFFSYGEWIHFQGR